MTDLFVEPDDATPLAPEEREGLRQNWITLRNELNAAEQDNIVKGATWVRRPRQVRRELLDDGFARTLHERMFGDVWLGPERTASHRETSVWRRIASPMTRS